ncbi:MAG TPA: DNA polymerase III subunit gamma/tau [Spirochaetota bacterium]|nr:DNA polymerase III subunit gamma/tau [Spirochaetota bacterium]HPJ33847.1 DNA polymerase III subunit gamma/tau [Spirochaetota bacterium]
MAYQVIARKWRPQAFSEVVFQEHVSKTIQNSIKQGRTSHAYLFSGPRGVGKTTMARILAKALNCVHGPTAEPCGVCENCIEIKQGVSFDVIEIDGASNNGVDNIRELRENVNFAPAKSKYKIYIIDEVHMVTTAAFNALLKTLEEPPPHIVFIFATTEIHKIPDTILSRCQKYFFKKIPIEVVVNHLSGIVKKEGYNISANALYPVARIADGSMRDAQSLLEQVISFSGLSTGDSTEISEQDALAILGVVPTESYIRLFNYIQVSDRKGIIAEVERIVSTGIDISRYSSGLVDAVRSLRLIRNGIDLQNLLGLSPDEINGLKSSSSGFGDEELSRIFKIAAELVKNLRFSGNDRVYLEMALLDMAAVIDTPSIADIIKRLEEGGGAHAGGETQPGSSASGDKSPAPGKASAPRDEKPLSMEDAWAGMLAEMELKKSTLHLILRPAVMRNESGNVILSYPEGIDSSNYIKALDAGTLALIENRLSAKTGVKVRVKVIGDAVQVPPSEKADAGTPEREPEADNSPAPEAEMVRTPETGDFAVESQAVQKIQNAFYGQIIKKGE